MPAEVPEAKPPRPSASSHSRDEDKVRGAREVFICSVGVSRREEALFLVVCRYVLRIWKVEPLLAPASTFLLSAGFKSGVERHAAIDENRRTVDVVGIVGSQPHRGAPDVVGFANALVRNQLHQLPIRFGCAPGLHIDRRAARAGGDAVDANAV